MTSMPADPRLWVVRHARPLVAPGTCYGRLDVPADPEASSLAARQLAQALPHPLAAAWHSPLQRCEQLAQSLQALTPHLSIKPCLALAEMHFGTWEGQAWDAIPRADLDAWSTQFAEHRPGHGEALSAMLQRVSAALEEARHAARAAQHDVLWITHAGVARCVQWLLTHGTRPPQAHEWTAPAPAYGAWITVALRGQDRTRRPPDSHSLIF